jgi:septal ring factor EnvC (AmiA/AmiB activator)
MRTFRILLVLATLLPLGLSSTFSQNEIKKRQAELDNIRNQIKEYEEKIRQQQKSEKATLELLDTYDKKGTLLRKLISRLKAEEQQLQGKIDGTRRGMTKLGDQLEFLKRHYASYVSSIYRTGRTHDIELLLSSNSINQFYVRREYLRRFTDQRKRDAQAIIAKRKQIEDTQAQLHIQLSEEQRLIAEKGSEEDRLTELTADRRDALTRIRKDKRNVQREIERQTKAAQDLEGIIAKLIEAERVRKEREEEESRKGILPGPLPPTGNFALKKGTLRWPVSEGRIVAHFGNRLHPTLKTITQSTGIDIDVKAGSPVVSVADGEVATIFWLPSYGNLIIMNHYGGYRTVYTHLAEIRVVEGQKVKEGEVIGYSGESLQGPRLHFELWKDRDKQNPETWLSRTP